MIMDVPMMFLTFCNFSIKIELILFAPQPQGHWTSSREKFLLKSPISATVKVMKSSLVIGKKAPLHPQDSPHQTYGCRHQNPDNYGSNSMENVCAFVTANNICKNPQQLELCNIKIYWCLPISQITLNKKSRKTPEGINRLLYLVKLLLKPYQQIYYLAT